MCESEKKFLLFVVLFTISGIILTILFIKTDYHFQQILFVEKNINIIKNQYIKDDSMESIQLIERNNKLDGYFMDIDKEYSIVKNENNEVVLLGVSGKFEKMKNNHKYERIRNELCPYLFYKLRKYNVILSGVSLSEDLNNILILKSDNDYCDLIEKENKLYLILDSKLIKKEKQNEK